MLKALFTVARLFVTVPFFELVGSVCVTAGVVVLAGTGWGLVAAGGLMLLKAFDLALAKDR